MAEKKVKDPAEETLKTLKCINRSAERIAAALEELNTMFHGTTGTLDKMYGGSRYIRTFPIVD